VISPKKEVYKCELERVKIVFGLDVVMYKVEGLMDKAIIGRFMGNIARGIF
jgi:hypothetical protein